jgi:carboxymethylenebutenolidase
MRISTEWVDLHVSDGTTMRGYVAKPLDTHPHATMLVFQEAFGVNPHIRDITERFARLGYVAIAPELFHRTGPGFEGSYTDFPALMPHFGALKDDQLALDIQTSYDWLQKALGRPSPTGAVGYCVGGRITTLAAMTVPIACGISYYGGGISPGGMFPSLLGRFRELKAPMMFFWGGLDQHIGSDAVRSVEDAAKAAHKTYTNVVFSYADHGFFCDARASFNKAASKQAWALTLEFLEVSIAERRAAGA